MLMRSIGLGVLASSYGESNDAEGHKETVILLSMYLPPTTNVIRSSASMEPSCPKYVDL